MCVMQFFLLFFFQKISSWMNECWYKSNEIFASLVFTKRTKRQLLQIYQLRVYSISDELGTSNVPFLVLDVYYLHWRNMLKASRQEDFSSVFAKYDGFFFKLSLTHFWADSGPMIQVLGTICSCTRCRSITTQSH